MNRATLALVRKLKDSQSRFLLVDSIIAGQPNTLLGYPEVECAQMPDPAADSLSIAFGSFSKGYTLVRRLGTRFLVDPSTNKPRRGQDFTRASGIVGEFQREARDKFDGITKSIFSAQAAIAALVGSAGLGALVKSSMESADALAKSAV